MEEKDKIIVKWAQERVETSNNMLNKINNLFYETTHKAVSFISSVYVQILCSAGSSQMPSIYDLPPIDRDSHPQY